MTTQEALKILKENYPDIEVSDLSKWKWQISDSEAPPEDNPVWLKNDRELINFVKDLEENN